LGAPPNTSSARVTARLEVVRLTKVPTLEGLPFDPRSIIDSTRMFSCTAGLG